MGISAVSSTTLSTFPQMNREINVQGEQAAKERSNEAAAYYKVSPFGDETKIGSSKFQQGLDTVISIGENKTSEIMEKAKSYTKVSNFGTETKLGSSKFQQQIKEISEQGAENLSKGMKATLDVTRVSNFGTETNLGHSRFQQANAQILEARQQAYTQFADFQKMVSGGKLDIGA